MRLPDRLRKGASEQARELIERGPPFDPAGVGLSHHEVFLSDGQVIFLLEGVGCTNTIPLQIGRFASCG